MEVPKGNENRDILQIGRILIEVWDKLYNLGQEKPGEEGYESGLYSREPRVRTCGLDSTVEKPAKERVQDRSRGIEARKVQRICRIWLITVALVSLDSLRVQVVTEIDLPPDNAFHEEGCEIATPSCAAPADTLT